MKNQSQFVRGQLWVHFDGQTFIFENPQSSRTRSKKKSLVTGDVASPMPGKITKILKNKGDKVGAGEAIIVMEAMKMEYTLKASIDGVIEELLCQINDQVTLGKVLAKIK